MKKFNKLIFIFLIVFIANQCSRSKGLTLVKDGTSAAIIVIAQNPTTVAAYAAEEFARHIKLATGTELKIVPESNIPNSPKNRIFIGETVAAYKKGIRTNKMVNDEFILRTIGKNLYVLGKEDPARDQINSGKRESRILHDGSEDNGPTSPNGTLFGVYELLQRYIGVRWLWPGDLGTYVPKTKNLTIEETLNEKHLPKLKFRRYAWFSISDLARTAESGAYKPYREDYLKTELYSKVEGLSFSAPVAIKYRDDLCVFLSRHRLGYSEEKPPTRHYFSGWWEQHGKEHPDWFYMKEDGTRGPSLNATPGEIRHVSMCVSNSELHNYIVNEVWDGGDYITLGEVDVRNFCQCENCKAWDGPQPKPGEYPNAVKGDYTPQLVSDRYARFWKTIQEMAAKQNPNVTVTTYLYWNYFPAPLGDIKLNKNVYGEFVPWTGLSAYYPMPDSIDKWVRAQWLGWKDKGIRIGYRPNHFHGGYVMPHISIRQAGDFFQFAYKNGMEGFRFDHLFGHWATKGPMLYMYMRLGWDPDMEIDSILQEYYSAFGPAAEHIKRYFNFWEEYSSIRPGGSLTYPAGAVNKAYPESVLATGDSILNEALKTVIEHSENEFAERVKFLQLGLEHAKLSASFTGEAKNLNSAIQRKKSQLALKELIEFRKKYEHLYIADLLDASKRETRGIDFDSLLQNTE